MSTQYKTLIKKMARLAQSNPDLRPHLLPLLRKHARGYPPAIESLMADFRRLQGVESVYVTDTWKDGYYHLRVVLKPQSGKTPWGGTSNTGIFEIQTTARGGFSTIYNFPLYPKIIRAVRALVKRSGLFLEGIGGLRKVYEYQDRYDRQRGTPKKGGYNDREISVEVYA